MHPVLQSRCWEYMGGRNETNYGILWTGPRGACRRIMAHRFAWEIQVGPIPEGLWVLHRCDNPSCVRTDHLFLGTHADNMRDMWQKGRRTTRRGADEPCRAR